MAEAADGTVRGTSGEPDQALAETSANQKIPHFHPRGQGEDLPASIARAGKGFILVVDCWKRITSFGGHAANGGL